jgi:hypothetical protein
MLYTIPVTSWNGNKVTEQAGETDNTSDLYPHGTQFESRPGYLLLLIEVFHGFPLSLRKKSWNGISN